MLSQLSYTPTKETIFILKHFPLPRIAEREAAGRFLAPCTPLAMTACAGVVQFNCRYLTIRLLYT